MKKFMLAGVGAFLCLCVAAQEDTIKPLSIGDTVPNIAFNNLYYYKSKTAKLSDFRGKLVILDFWAAWCGSCMDKFSSLDSLQKMYPKKLQVILINATKRTTDDHAKIKNVIGRWEAANGKTFSCISSEDSVTDYNKLFLHTSVPHYVIIGRHGQVVAITSSEYITPASIGSLIQGEKISLPLKQDVLIFNNSKN